MAKRSADMIAALEHRKPSGKVPIWELSFQLWDAASGRHVVLGHEFEKLTPAEQERAMHTNAEIILSVCEDLHFSGLTTPGNYWYQGPGELAYYVLPGESRFRQFQIISEMAGDSVLLIAGTGGVICANYSEDFCVRLAEAPEEIDALAESTLRHGIENARRFRDLGAGAVLSSSDIADNSGPFFNPRRMQRFILPYLDRWAKAAREMGMFSILHTDGQLTRYLDDIASTAVDAMQAIDPVAGMDMVESRRIVGDRLCLCGNIDCGLLVMGTPEQVYESARTLLENCRQDAGFVFGASNAVQPEVPVQNYRAMIEAWRTYG